MTWGDFKRAVEDAGIEDDNDIGHIHWDDPEEISVTPYSEGFVTPYSRSKKFANDGDEPGDESNP